MVTIDVTTIATIVGTWVLVVGTLAFAYWQLRQAQRLHSATTLLDLRERFYSPRMRHARRELSTWLLKSERGEEIDNWEVGIFFEMLGFLTHNRVLERRMVWNAFGTWVTAYYAYLHEPVNYFDKWRSFSHDPLIFAEFEWLARQMLEFDVSASGTPTSLRTAITDAHDILEAETVLDLRPLPDT